MIRRRPMTKQEFAAMVRADEVRAVIAAAHAEHLAKPAAPLPAKITPPVVRPATETEAR